MYVFTDTTDRTRHLYFQQLILRLLFYAKWNQIKLTPNRVESKAIALSFDGSKHNKNHIRMFLKQLYAKRIVHMLNIVTHFVWKREC